MKLAEALMNRADCQKRIEQLKVRLSRSAKVQEGEHPPEDPKELLPSCKSKSISTQKHTGGWTPAFRK